MTPNSPGRDPRRAVARSPWSGAHKPRRAAVRSMEFSIPAVSLGAAQAFSAATPPEAVEKICVTPREQFLEVADAPWSSGATAQARSSTHSAGTDHTVGVQCIRAASIVQLLLGNIGLTAIANLARVRDPALTTRQAFRRAEHRPALRGRRTPEHRSRGGQRDQADHRSRGDQAMGRSGRCRARDG